jgi:hypothetical protein
MSLSLRNLLSLKLLLLNTVVLLPIFCYLDSFSSELVLALPLLSTPPIYSQDTSQGNSLIVLISEVVSLLGAPQ